MTFLVVVATACSQLQDQLGYVRSTLPETRKTMLRDPDRALLFSVKKDMIELVQVQTKTTAEWTPYSQPRIPSNCLHCAQIFVEEFNADVNTTDDGSSTCLHFGRKLPISLPTRSACLNCSHCLNSSRTVCACMTVTNVCIRLP